MKHDSIEDTKVRYQANYQHYLAELKKTNLIDKKCSVSLAGFEKIVRDRTQEVNSLINQVSDLESKRHSLEQLREQERHAASIRTEELQRYYKLVYEST